MQEFVVRTFDALEVQNIKIVLYRNTNLHSIQTELLLVGVL